MSPRPKALISWSSGKDSAFALHEVRRSGQFEVVGALTTVTETFGRVSIHGVRQEILQAQCEAAGLPPHIVPIPYPCPNEIYEARMGEADPAAGACDDLKRYGSLSRHRRSEKLPAKFAGRKFDSQLLADLPDSVDPCGENGEFHTCVVAGPIFTRRLPVVAGERVERDGYAYCDLVLEGPIAVTTGFVIPGRE
jgi:diphthamide synthase (EF-2-diphthine--ammonia ligase)